MPKFEDRPSGEEKADSGRRDNEAEEEIPPLSDFNSDRNIVQWRPDNLFPLLHAPETRFSASSEVMLNGSQHFQQVYGSGAKALAFQSTVDGTFLVVTNVTQYHHHGSLGNLCEAENGGQTSVSAGHASGSQIHSEQQTMALAAQEEPMEEESGDVFTDGDGARGGESGDVFTDGDGARGGESGDVFTDGDGARGGESGDVFTDGDGARGGESGEFVWRPPSQPCYVPLVWLIPCRRHVSVEILKIC